MTNCHIMKSMLTCNIFQFMNYYLDHKCLNLSIFDIPIELTHAPSSSTKGVTIFQGSSSSTKCQLPRMHSFIHRMHKHKLPQLIIISIRVITFIIELGYQAPRESHSFIIFYLTQRLLDKHKFTNSQK